MASLITFCSSSPCSFPQRRPILVPYQRLVLVRTIDLEFLDLQSFFFLVELYRLIFSNPIFTDVMCSSLKDIESMLKRLMGRRGPDPRGNQWKLSPGCYISIESEGVYIYTHIYAFTMEESNFILFPQHDHTVLYIDHSDIVHISAQIPDHLEGKKHPDHMAPQWRPMPQVWRHHLVHWRSGLSKASPRRSAVGCSGMLGY